MPLPPFDVAAHAGLGLAWNENGQSVLSGALLELYERLDRTFVGMAAECSAERIRFPTFIPSRELAKLDYFRSFPHLVTFPVALDQDDESNLKAFADGEPMDPSGALNFTRLAPTRDVLTPAACYHIYVRLQGQDLDGPRFVTTVNTCFRREKRYAPLERQWAFSMREIVCVGAQEEVLGFLERYRARVTRHLAAIGLPVEWVHATDPFFNPKKNPKFIAQRLEPVKHEMVFQGSLAIGSVNFHRNYMGDSFEIKRCGETAYSGCVAFGLERWILAYLHTFGADPAQWPTGDGTS